MMCQEENTTLNVRELFAMVAASTQNPSEDLLAKIKMRVAECDRRFADRSNKCKLTQADLHAAYCTVKDF